MIEGLTIEGLMIEGLTIGGLGAGARPNHVIPQSLNP
jgi:hypothetical protein